MRLGICVGACMSGPSHFGEWTVVYVDHVGLGNWTILLWDFLVTICFYMGVRHAWEVPSPLQVNVSAWSLFHSWCLVVASCLKKLIFYRLMLITEPRTIDKFWAHSPISSQSMSSWCVFLDPHLIAHLSYIGVQFEHVTKLGMLASPTRELGTVSWTQPYHVNIGLGKGHVY